MRMLTAALFLALAVGVAGDLKAPSFVWGSSNLILPSPNGEARRVSYRADSTELLDDVLGSALGGGTLRQAAQSFFQKEAAAPHVTVLFLGRQMDVGQASSLHAALDKAAASVSLPYMQHEGGSVKERLLQLANGAAASASVHHVGSCGPGGAALLQGAQMPALSADKRAVVVVCPSEADSQEDEMEVLEVLTAAVSALDASHLFVYTQQAAALGAQRRSLLAKDSLSAAAPSPEPSPPGEMVCDARCRTQVSQLEAGILLLTLLVALALGTFCMGILDTPTRFEQVKDDR